jgi:thioredoxin-like negative regulator of GroEL
MRQVTDATFETEVEKGSGLILVDFWAEWLRSLPSDRPGA